MLFRSGRLCRSGVSIASGQRNGHRGRPQAPDPKCAEGKQAQLLARVFAEQFEVLAAEEVPQPKAKEELGTCKCKCVEVGTSVARRPPHRSRRAVFSHRALQVNSLSHTPTGASQATYAAFDRN